MTEETVQRIDFNAPPPGYTAEGQWWSYPSPTPSHPLPNIAMVAPSNGALAAAWAHYKDRHDPPGLRTRPWGFGGWVFCCGLIVDPQPGPRKVMLNDDGQPYASEADARAAAWAWYERRLEIAARLESILRRALRTVILATEAAYFSKCEICTYQAWPRCLTWSDEQVAEVERWLVDPAEMPEVLRG